MFKIINAKGHLTKTAKAEFKTAYVTGSSKELAAIVFPNAYANDRKFKRVTDLMKSINLTWYAFDDDVYVISRWFYEAVSDRSEAAAIEAKNLIG